MRTGLHQLFQGDSFFHNWFQSIKTVMDFIWRRPGMGITKLYSYKTISIESYFLLIIFFWWEKYLIYHLPQVSSSTSISKIDACVLNMVTCYRACSHTGNYTRHHAEWRVCFGCHWLHALLVRRKAAVHWSASLWFLLYNSTYYSILRAVPTVTPPVLSCWTTASGWMLVVRQ